MLTRRVVHVATSWLLVTCLQAVWRKSENTLQILVVEAGVISYVRGAFVMIRFYRFQSVWWWVSYFIVWYMVHGSNVKYRMSSCCHCGGNCVIVLWLLSNLRKAVWTNSIRARFSLEVIEGDFLHVGTNELVFVFNVECMPSVFREERRWRQAIMWKHVMWLLVESSDVLEVLLDLLVTWMYGAQCLLVGGCLRKLIQEAGNDVVFFDVR